MTLIEFLLTRIAEDEAAQKIGDPYGECTVDGDVHWTTPRIIAECEAKMQIIAQHEPWTETGGVVCPTCRGAGNRRQIAPCTTLRILAAIYRYHPDYDPAWIA